MAQLVWSYQHVQFVNLKYHMVFRQAVGPQVLAHKGTNVWWYKIKLLHPEDL